MLCFTIYCLRYSKYDLKNSNIKDTPHPKTSRKWKKDFRQRVAHFSKYPQTNQIAGFPEKYAYKLLR